MTTSLKLNGRVRVAKTEWLEALQDKGEKEVVIYISGLPKSGTMGPTNMNGTLTIDVSTISHTHPEMYDAILELEKILEIGS